MPLKISSWFAPAKRACLICGRDSAQVTASIPIKHPEARQAITSLCGSCRQSIPWIAHPVCRICGRAERCEDCIRRQTRYYSISRCAVRYDDRMKDWLALYKYRGNEGVESILTAMLAFAYERLCEAAAHSEFHAITSVPLAPERLQDRGFNQAERLALRLSGWYGVEYRPMLSRLRHTEKQSLKTRRSRVVDMRGNFSAATSELFSNVASPRIILIDDIYTTGSTLDECARVLKLASRSETTAEIYGLLWARS
ncbi:ComF family protein [Cohnella luojiensis]|uniref:ComF family protein n=1 Tax=Cohnella luojiensis TaxID=652876 RepID=A0A4Y8M3Z1_9BACL|nr:ComF family protein [Cohnella luojiensis]TFE29022.1 ComF family protein [Cohnella luojiensis]